MYPLLPEIPNSDEQSVGRSVIAWRPRHIEYWAANHVQSYTWLDFPFGELNEDPNEMGHELNNPLADSTTGISSLAPRGDYIHSIRIKSF
jgi:hypothetical protein